MLSSYKHRLTLIEFERPRVCQRLYEYEVFNLACFNLLADHPLIKYILRPN